jgi:phosphopantetheinyl transferase (holo-ACP synthase)
MDNGAPFIKLHGKALEFSKNLKIKDIKISVSATEKFAIACAVAII